MVSSRYRKAFGQHFLKNQEVITCIASQVFSEHQRVPCQQLLEIGPGKGALTSFFLNQPMNRPSSYLLVEKDPQFAALWQKTPGDACRVLQADFLELPFDAWLGSYQQVGVVSNLPYSCGTAILSKLVPFQRQVPWMVLMLQAEVAERLIAPPGNSHRGRLSVFVQNAWTVEKIRRVPPQDFTPPPQVFSEVIVLRPRASLFVSVTPAEEPLWSMLLKKVFSQKRKMIRSFLVDSFWKGILEQSGVESSRRAEALLWSEWKNLWEALKKNKPSVTLGKDRQ